MSALIAIKRRGDGADIQLLLYLGRASYRLWLVSFYRLTENGGRHLLHVALSPTCRPPALSGQWKNVPYFWPWQRDPIPRHNPDHRHSCHGLRMRGNRLRH